MINIQFTQEEIQDLVDRAIIQAEGYVNSQRWADAEALLRQTLRVHPEYQPALRLLSQILMSHQKGAEAIEFYEKTLVLDPNNYEALNNVALCYASEGDIKKAIDYLVKCSILYPDNPACYWNLAIHYKEDGDFESCFTIYEKGIEFFPEHAELRYNYAIALAEKQRHEEAIFHYKKAIEIKPDFASAHHNLSLLNLALNNYKEGWQGYDWRFEYATGFKLFKARFAGKEWQGEDGEGKTILVYNEQGAGDTIQFARFLPKLKEKGFKVILEVLPELTELLASCKGVDQIVAQRFRKTPAYDYHVSIGTLPKLLDVQHDKSLWNGPYLHPTGEVDKAFENYKDNFKIGICWAGNPVHKQDALRSTYLKYFKPLNDMHNTKLFSLQKDSRPRFWSGKGVVDLTDGCEDMGVVDMGDLLVNFNYTAAIMKNMNAIVTVDTAIAHVAGAMGQKCYLLLPYSPDWRWGLHGKKSFWYPSLTLVRQLKPGDYESRLKNIAYEIRQ
jgi:tetratricopeptide (TPR) repeat protein